jgi:hypothetical protein
MPRQNSPEVGARIPVVPSAKNASAIVMTSTGDPETKPESLPTGTKPEAVNLYRKDGIWTSEYPFYVEDPPENGETSQYALVIRYARSVDTRKKFMIHSIIVQSPFIKRILGSVLNGYPGVTTDLDRLEFEAPFEPLVHRWHLLEQAKTQEQDPLSKEHVVLFWEILEAELSDSIKTSSDLVSHGVMTYKLLWTLFEPGSLVYSKDDGYEIAMRVEAAYYSNGSFTVRCMFVDWDGTKFGMALANREVPSFKGTTAITRLDIYPLMHHPDRSALEQRLIARGKIFESLAGYHFKSYSGVGIDTMAYPRPIKYTLNSRFIIDTDAYNRFNPNYAVLLFPLLDDKSYFGESGDKSARENEDDEADYRKTGEKGLSMYHFLISSASVRGYAIMEKKWLQIWVEPIQEIVWNDRAFDSLVLPVQTKSLILALAESQVKYEQRFDDVIQGKGKGIVMLLSGPPGVGKTLTAESVAETMSVPLYSMSAGDLGVDPRGVETALRDILALTTKWKAVVLLDECDVFLEARSPHDLERNKLVSIFLRVLEYYEGLLFLTSNRVDDLDTAFESRIHLSIHYGELNAASRRSVWETFLAGANALGNFTEADLVGLAELEMNGRQIKNVLKTAQLLATRAKAPLALEHVDIVTQFRSAN